MGPHGGRPVRYMTSGETSLHSKRSTRGQQIGLQKNRWRHCSSFVGQGTATLFTATAKRIRFCRKQTAMISERWLQDIWCCVVRSEKLQKSTRLKATCPTKQDQGSNQDSRKMQVFIRTALCTEWVLFLSSKAPKCPPESKRRRPRSSGLHLIERREAQA